MLVMAIQLKSNRDAYFKRKEIEIAYIEKSKKRTALLTKMNQEFSHPIDYLKVV